MEAEPDRTALCLQARGHVRRVRNLKRHAAVYAAGVALSAVWIVARYQSSGGWPRSPWVIWPLLAWTQILFVHALVTYLRRPVSEAEVRRELERLERGD